MLNNPQMTTSARLDASAAAALSVAAEQVKEPKAASVKGAASTRKDKTILNWFVKSAAVTAGHTAGQSKRLNGNKSETPPAESVECSCTAENEKTRAFFKNRADSGLRDFRGVQSLRHLWNKRINASVEETTPSRGSFGTLRKLNKSVNCLVNAFNNARESPAKRTLSLHDCRQVEVAEALTPTATSTTTAQLEKLLHREKDNFYKYKNAEQAALLLAREAKMRDKLRRSSFEQPAESDMTKRRQCDDVGASHEPIINECVEPTLRLSDKQRSGRAISAGNSPAHNADSRPLSRVSQITESVKRGSNGSLHSRSNTPTTGQRNAPRRKYSFKTHAGKCYHQHHTPRRNNVFSMPGSLTSGVGSAAAGGEAGSMVAKLTQQFNEIIQKDRRVLEEVKRKNGVWLSRGSHVYKVVKKQPAAAAATAANGSTVQRNINKFEKLDTLDAVAKPAVPLKTEQVLHMQRELLAMQSRSNSLPLGKQLRQKRLTASRLQPQQLEPELPMVREEAKAPIESEDKPMDTGLGDAIKPKPATETDTTAPTAATTKTAVAVNTAAEAESAPAAGNNANDMEDAVDAERQKQRKNKYAKIYEKFRFRSPFSSGSRSRSSSSNKSVTSSPSRSIPEIAESELASVMATPTNDDIETATEAAEELIDVAACTEAEVRLLDALEVVDEKLRMLSAGNGERLLDSNNDFECIQPNNSFVYQAVNKQVCNNKLFVTQAVNVALVNAIEGEQMVMEQKQLHEEPMYEPIAQQQQQPASKVYQLKAKSVNSEDIYQTVEETQLLAKSNCQQVYESIENSCEADNSQKASYDGYETFAPISEQQPVTPTTGTLGRNTNDELPELPQPKRRLPKSPMPLRRAPARPTTLSKASQMPQRLPTHNAPEEHHYYADDDDENIYDTIKGADCYESMVKSKASGTTVPAAGNARLATDNVSLISNCYESLSSYRKSKPPGSCIQLSSSGSTLTISSDHKTNSLYESSLPADSTFYGVGRRSSLASGSGSGRSEPAKQSDNRSSIAASSENSDGWVDISDTEMREAQFIVVRERFKAHRSPDWSKRIRDKRLQQKKAISCIEDDSDHYYETLSPQSNKRHSTQLEVQRNASLHHKRNQDAPRYMSNGIRQSQRQHKRQSASAHQLGEQLPKSDDYDSFDTDTDEQEQEERLKTHNDSGVDIHNHRLPEPPASHNQVYAILRRFREFISSKKSKASQQKLYENTSQFYVDSSTLSQGGGNLYEKSHSRKLRSKKSPQPQPQQQNIYEGTDSLHARNLSNSEKNLLNQDEPAADATATFSKTKNGQSLGSRLRKSLVGSSLDAKQLSTLSPTRSTFYIEDPGQHGSGELDSGFSEKASSGDIPVQATPVPSAESQKFSTTARKHKKESKASNTQRRRSSLGIRPHEPPPPPPENKQSSGQKSRDSSTSWYAECGVFKQANGPPLLQLPDTNVGGGGISALGDTTPSNGSVNGNGHSSWYAESGLYQTSDVSVASSSGSSGVSTGNEAGLGDELQPHSMFPNEPFYQIYSAEKLESITRDLVDHENFTDGYEEIEHHAPLDAHSTTGSLQRNNDSKLRKSTRPTALQLVEPKNGPSRTLWSEIPEVIQSCILPTLTPRERCLQEAKFEIITSEASYLKSLNLLRRHFMNNAAFCDSNVLSTRDRKALFSYILPVHECSERLLTELESCWQNNIMLLGLSRRILDIAEQQFHVYVAFCEHQGRMDRTLRQLKEAKGAFQQQLEKLEANANCCGLNLHSFLMLPMQRITRLPLLIDAVFSKVSPHDDEYNSWKMTLATVQKVVAQCNEAANVCEQAYELERISKQLEFPSSIRALAIAPVGVRKLGDKPRFLVKRGELTHLVWRGDDAKLTFGKRFSKSSIYAFLFSDLLVLTKRKGESSFAVFDYCPRSMLTIASADALPQLPTKDIKDQTGKNLILMTLLENHESKTIELMLSCPSVSDQQRWLQAMRPPEAETPGEKLYESWDCPQVIAKHSYTSSEPDVLNLEVGDVVNVSRKLPDDWYQGERIRDGAVGWFPGNYTEEVNSAHVRARNLKQRHRLLTFSASYIDSQQSKRK